MEESKDRVIITSRLHERDLPGMVSSVDRVIEKNLKLYKDEEFLIKRYREQESYKVMYVSEKRYDKAVEAKDIQDRFKRAYNKLAQTLTETEDQYLSNF